MIRQKIGLGLLLVLLGATLNVKGQVTINVQPQDKLNMNPGANVSFSVTASGTGALKYQWRLNGGNITNATNSSFFISEAQPTNGGSYSVAVSDKFSSINSDTAQLTFNITSVTPADKLTDGVSLTSSSGLLRTVNTSATKESGEPDHAGKRGGKSIWFKWVAPAQGIVTFYTTGSGFDTLLAAYNAGESYPLTPVPSSINDDDRGGFFTSRISFNAGSQKEYEIAVDGFAGASGDVVLTWSFEQTTQVLPTITFSSPSRTLALGQSVTLFYNATFTTTATWFFNGQSTGINGSQFTIDNASEADVGNYEVHVFAASGRSVIAPNIRIQINANGSTGADTNSATYEKFLDNVDAIPGQGRPAGVQKFTAAGASGGLASGYTSSQIFSTAYSSKDVGEPNHCDEPGGASEWYSFQPTNTGTLQINTDGSSYNTVLAIYTGPGTDYATLVPTTCDNSSGNGGDRVLFSATPSTTYFIAVDGVGGARGTAHLNINFGDPPLIVTAPTNQVVAAGSNATFVVSATGSATLRYRWQLNGVDILGATNTSYTVTNVQAAKLGDYTVIVSNVVQSVTSSPPANLSLRAAPSISVQPTNQSAAVNSNVTFSVTASGNPSPTYQWRFGAGATNLAGATNSSYTINNLQTNNAGIYSVLVSNVAGTATSSNATLTVNTLPVFTLDPLSQTSNIGGTINFSGSATGSPPVFYQWRFGGGNIAGATNTTLSVTNIQTTNAGNYRLIASNVAGTTMSAIAVLTVNSSPVITTQPQSTTVTLGSNASLTVTATGTPTPVYQWRFNTTNLSGQTASTLTLTNFQTNNEGDYSVIVSNSVAPVTSSNATLKANSPMRLESFLFSNNIVQAQLIGIVGTNYIFQASSNLSTWTSLITNNATNGFITFSDSNAASFSTRSYRVQQKP